MKQVLAFLQANKVFYLATAKGDEPKVRPLGFVMEYDGKLYFGVGDQKDVYKQMVANPKVEISTTNPETGQWIRIHGKAAFDPRPELFTAAVKVLPMLKDMYGDPAGPKLGCFYLTEAEAIFYDMQGNSKTVKL
ncbi:pyridoxamine 5'-phosphate oxidase family protein [Deltaproteobacteria bacterium OttesenSCG-928-M10]|nr:pyridoxamine 5'-phosphate oxidase family protein [Deltaproteobacteria bacterium OttesenSCG-928-M10]